MDSWTPIHSNPFGVVHWTTLVVGFVCMVLEHRRGWQRHFLSPSRRIQRTAWLLLVPLGALALLVPGSLASSALAVLVALAVLEVTTTLEAAVFTYAMLMWFVPAAAPGWTASSEAQSDSVVLSHGRAFVDTGAHALVGALVASAIAVFLTVRRRSS